MQMALVPEPNAVGDDLVKAEAEFRRPAAQGMHKLGVKEGLTSCEAENAYSIGTRGLEEAQRHANVEPVRPFNGNAAVGAGQVALIRAGKGQIVGTESSRAAADRPAWTAGEWRRWRGRHQEDSRIEGSADNIEEARNSG